MLQTWGKFRDSQYKFTWTSQISRKLQTVFPIDVKWLLHAIFRIYIVS
jgi:hypothetical protein